ncbi:MAG: hypothetical protein F6K17_14640 [Okeania sp. SIO3C4]|nr:hypothetical protein [Okeania sp. SIO3C4]
MVEDGTFFGRHTRLMVCKEEGMSDQKIRSQVSPFKGIKKNKFQYFNSLYFPFVMLRKQVLITDN